MKLFGAAVAAAGLLVSSAALAVDTQDRNEISIVGAAPEGREVVTLKVPTDGLNLATPEGAKALRKRVQRAIAYACNPGDRLDADLSPDYQCRQEMALNVEPRLAAITQDALARPTARN